MEKIRVGICGLGSMGMHHTLMLVKHENVELVAAADMEEAKRQRAKDELNVSHIFADGREMIRSVELDAVWVCAPTYLHAELTVQALEKGCHVFCEKPMARSEEECAAMQAAADKSGKFLMIGQVLRFWPEYVFLKNTVASGKYGKLLTLSMTRVGGVSTGYENWFLDEARGGTQIFDRHIHDTDAVLWICGNRNRCILRHLSGTVPPMAVLFMSLRTIISPAARWSMRKVLLICPRGFPLRRRTGPFLNRPAWNSTAGMQRL